MRFLRRPVTAMYDCHASVRTQQNEDRKKKWRNAAIRVHKTWKHRARQGEDQENERTWGVTAMDWENCIRVMSSSKWDLTLFHVWVCPMRIRALDEMMERQKLMRMTDRSDRMYLQEDHSYHLVLYTSVHQSSSSRSISCTVQTTDICSKCPYLTTAHWFTEKILIPAFTYCSNLLMQTIHPFRWHIPNTLVTSAEQMFGLLLGSWKYIWKGFFSLKRAHYLTTAAYVSGSRLSWW